MFDESFNQIQLTDAEYELLQKCAQVVLACACCLPLGLLSNTQLSKLVCKRVRVRVMGSYARRLIG